MLEVSLDTRRGSFHLQVECIFQSEWTVIFGPSGAGKTRFLRLLAGLDRPERGRIVLDGEVITDAQTGAFLKPGKRKTALVAQYPALFPHMSVVANVSYGLVSLDRDSRSATVEEMLRLVGADGLVHRRPHHLSGGEAQRVALARALAPRPRLLLLDEPFSALDGTASDALLSRLKGWLRDHHVQTILVTHDATDAYATGAKVALLREGRIAALGAPGVALASERQRILERLGTADQ